ncbi:MAG: pseudouridine synthase [Candidatus Absconditabacteria bacterium]
MRIEKYLHLKKYNNMKYFDGNFYFVWKPQGLPSTFGQNNSFVDGLIKDKFFIDNGLSELGLLNRLDNDTGGLLYFALNKDVYNEYKILQSEGRLLKIYIADVHGKIKSDTVIAFPIMHSKFFQDRMIVIKNSNLIFKGRGKKHFVETYLEVLYYDEVKNITTLRVYIEKGIRHQIRSHLQSIGHPVVGDKIYAKYTNDDKLHLRSIGLIRK